MGTQIVQGIEIVGPMKDGYDSILTEDALEFFAMLQREFNPRRKQLLQRRMDRQKELNAGKKPDFLKETKEVRNSDWKVAPIPKDLQDRRVEITGPVDRKMIINALNSGARVFMADFEDSNSPTWETPDVVSTGRQAATSTTTSPCCPNACAGCESVAATGGGYWGRRRQRNRD